MPEGKGHGGGRRERRLAGIRNGSEGDQVGGPGLRGDLDENVGAMCVTLTATGVLGSGRLEEATARGVRSAGEQLHKLTMDGRDAFRELPVPCRGRSFVDLRIWWAWAAYAAAASSEAGREVWCLRPVVLAVYGLLIGGLRGAVLHVLLCRIRLLDRRSCLQRSRRSANLRDRVR